MKITKNNDIIHTRRINEDLNIFLKNYKSENILVLTDENCQKHCLPLLPCLEERGASVFTFAPGEKSKNIDTLQKIWIFMQEKKIDRNSLIIATGGGVVTDIAGFASTTFKRGVDFLNIPTSLLAQVDASAGGKNGINFRGLKNEIGTFSSPVKVFIDTVFLHTLPEKEFRSGFAEMLKHGLIYDYKYYEKLIRYYAIHSSGNLDLETISNLVKQSVEIKQHFVNRDFRDNNIRHILNFGHTFGHAFESFFNTEKQTTVLHGYAVAWGMICALYLAVKKTGFSKSCFEKIKHEIKQIYSLPNISSEKYFDFAQIMLHDKKNIQKKIMCVLPHSPGQADKLYPIDYKDIKESLNQLNS
ncbi:MAG: 3-dehydroquinate synthase [Bacteroidia bacterium]|nr:MAG: 3-dehydroquinate synthase [Bacteroidia bacterium]